MGPGGRRCDPPARSSGQQARPDEERLGHFLDRLHLFPDSDGEGADADRAAAEAAYQRVQDTPVEPVQAEVVHVVDGEGLAGYGLGDDAVRPDLGEVPNPAQQPVRDAWRSARTAGDLAAPSGSRRTPSRVAER